MDGWNLIKGKIESIKSTINQHMSKIEFCIFFPCKKAKPNDCKSSIILLDNHHRNEAKINQFVKLMFIT